MSDAIYPVGSRVVSDEEFLRIAKADTEPLPFCVHVDKQIHRVRFENETEDHVTIVIERKERAK